MTRWPRLPGIRRLALLGALATSACQNDCNGNYTPWTDDSASSVDEPAASGPPVGTVFIVPPDVDVEQGVTHKLKLRVLVLGTDGLMREASAGTVTWSVPAGSGVTVPASTTGAVAEFTLVQPAAGDVVVTATVTSGGSPVSGTATLHMPKLADVESKRDLAMATSAVSTLPRVALFTGSPDGVACEEDSRSAFTALGRLTSLTAPPVGGTCRGEVALFSSNAASWLTNAGGLWSNERDWMHATTSGGGRTPVADAGLLTVNLKVVLGVEAFSVMEDNAYGFSVEVDYDVLELQALARARLEAMVKMANYIFEANRVGVELLAVTPWHEEELPTVKGCSTVPTTGTAAAQPGQLTVYWVNRLGPVAGSPNPRGVTCQEADLPGTPMTPERRVILISHQDSFLASTLAHEVGHALALRWPVHVNGELISGFGTHNLMAEVAGVDDSRFHLTFGQVYRMNFYDRSWLNVIGIRTGGVTKVCTCGRSAPHCPVLERDFSNLQVPISVGTSCLGTP